MESCAPVSRWGELCHVNRLSPATGLSAEANGDGRQCSPPEQAFLCLFDATAVAFTSSPRPGEADSAEIPFYTLMNMSSVEYDTRTKSPPEIDPSSTKPTASGLQQLSQHFPTPPSSAPARWQHCSAPEDGRIGVDAAWCDVTAAGRDVTAAGRRVTRLDWSLVGKHELCPRRQPVL